RTIARASAVLRRARDVARLSSTRRAHAPGFSYSRTRRQWRSARSIVSWTSSSATDREPVSTYAVAPTAGTQRHRTRRSRPPRPRPGPLPRPLSARPYRSYRPLTRTSEGSRFRRLPGGRAVGPARDVTRPTVEGDPVEPRSSWVIGGWSDQEVG